MACELGGGKTGRKNRIAVQRKEKNVFGKGKRSRELPAGGD